MTAAALIRQTLAQIRANARQLLPMMGLIWLIQLPFYFTYESLPKQGLINLGMPEGAWSTAIANVVVLLAVYLGTAWTAVGWHRLSILGEGPGFVTPRWRPKAVIGYLIASIFIPLIAWIGPVLAGLLLFWLLQRLVPPPILGLLISPLVVAGVYLTLRMSPVLVSLAIGTKEGIEDAMTRTRHLSRPIWVVSVIAVIAAALLFWGMSAVTMMVTDADGYFYDFRVTVIDSLTSAVGTFVFFLGTVSLFNTVYRNMSPELTATPEAPAAEGAVPAAPARDAL